MDVRLNAIRMALTSIRVAAGIGVQGRTFVGNSLFRCLRVEEELPWCYPGFLIEQRLFAEHKPSGVPTTAPPLRTPFLGTPGCRPVGFRSRRVVSHCLATMPLPFMVSSAACPDSSVSAVLCSTHELPGVGKLRRKHKRATRHRQ